MKKERTGASTCYELGQQNHALEQLWWGQDVLVIYSLRFIYFDKLLLVILVDMLGISFGILIQAGLWKIEGSEHS